MADQRKFYRSRTDRMISGICGGIAEYFGIDPVFVRLIAVVLLVVGNVGVVIAYLIMAVVVPEEPLPGAAEDTTPAPPPAEPPAAPAVAAAAVAADNVTVDAGTGESSDSAPVEQPPTESAGEPVPEQPPVPEPVTPAAAPAAPAEGGHRRPKGLTGGIVLILIGLVLLAAQFVPGVGLWNLWPLIIVIAGVVQAVTPGPKGWNVERFFDGLVTVAIGLVFLAITFGYVGWSVWWRLLTLWPVLLISLGFSLIGRALHASWLKALGSIVVIAAIVFAAVSSPTSSPVFAREGGEAFELSAPLPSGADEASLEFNAGAGVVTIGDGSELFSAKGVTPFGTPALAVDESGDPVEVAFNQSDNDSVVTYPGAPSARVDAELARSVGWDVTLNTGVTDLTADFSNVDLSALELRTGVSDSKITLGDVAQGVDEGEVVVRGGVASVLIWVPQDMEVRVESQTGLSTVNVDPLIESTGSGNYETAGYEAAKAAGEPVWNISVQGGLGSIRIDTY